MIHLLVILVAWTVELQKVSMMRDGMTTILYITYQASVVQVVEVVIFQMPQPVLRLKFICMNKRKSQLLLFPLLISILVACEKPHTNEGQTLPSDVEYLDNLTVINPAELVPDTVELEKVAVYESSDDIYMEGRLSEFTVDDRERVYIAATQMGRLGIYVFAPDGDFITRIAPYGRGPGEYESIRSIDVHDNKLYLLDARLQKYGIFELDGFTHVKDHGITKNRLTESDSLALMFNLHDLIVNDDHLFILQLRMFPRSRRFPVQPEVYHSMDSDGAIVPGKLLEQKGLTYYFPAQGISTPYLMPFSRSSLVSVTNDGRFLTARTDNFLIKEYDQTATYRRAFYYPVENAALSLDEIPLERDQERMLDQYDLPETWPALHTMELDDEERLWVATITESDSTFQWHVIDESGTQLAQFTLPGSRASRSAYTKPLVMIKNGYFYHQEQEVSRGIDHIVKHKIHFKQR